MTYFSPLHLLFHFTLSYFFCLSLSLLCSPNTPSICFYLSYLECKMQKRLQPCRGAHTKDTGKNTSPSFTLMWIRIFGLYILGSRSFFCTVLRNRIYTPYVDMFGSEFIYHLKIFLNITLNSVSLHNPYPDPLKNQPKSDGSLSLLQISFFVNI